MYKYIQIHAQTHTHTHMYTYIHLNCTLSFCTLIYILWSCYEDSNAYTHTRAHARVCVCMCVCVRVRVCVCACACVCVSDIFMDTVVCASGSPRPIEWLLFKFSSRKWATQNKALFKISSETHRMGCLVCLRAQKEATENTALLRNAENTALLRNATTEDRPSYGDSPPCTLTISFYCTCTTHSLHIAGTIITTRTTPHFTTGTTWWPFHVK